MNTEDSAHVIAFLIVTPPGLAPRLAVEVGAAVCVGVGPTIDAVADFVTF